MATFVLVHGGAHGGWCYGRVASLLRAGGHDVYTPTLTGVGERSHLLRADLDLDFHVRDILAVLHYEDLREVILVGHSYGGMVITGVADREPARIAHLVYLDAAMPGNGQALADIAAPLMAAAHREMRVVDGVELVLFPGTEPMPNYGLTNPRDIAWTEARLTPHPWKCFTQPLQLTNEAALWEIPQSVICCTSSLAFRDPSSLERASRAGRVWDIDTGHDLMISEPGAVAELLLRVAAGSQDAARYLPQDESRT